MQVSLSAAVEKCPASARVFWPVDIAQRFAVIAQSRCTCLLILSRDELQRLSPCLHRIHDDLARGTCHPAYAVGIGTQSGKLEVFVLLGNKAYGAAVLIHRFPAYFGCFVPYIKQGLAFVAHGGKADVVRLVAYIAQGFAVFPYGGKTDFFRLFKNMAQRKAAFPHGGKAYDTALAEYMAQGFAVLTHGGKADCFALLFFIKKFQRVGVGSDGTQTGVFRGLFHAQQRLAGRGLSVQKKIGVCSVGKKRGSPAGEGGKAEKHRCDVLYMAQGVGVLFQCQLA